MIDFKDLSPLEQVFFKKTPEREYAIAVERLIASIKYNGTEMIPCDADVANRLRQEAGIEKHRSQKLQNMYLDKFLKLPPVLVIWFKDDTWALADGNHRYIEAHRRGLKEVRAYVATRQQWAPFIVKGHPQGNYNGFSGIVR